MAEPVVIRGEHGQFVTLEMTAWGEDSVALAVEVQSEGFSGSTADEVLIAGLVRFRDDLRRLCQTWDHQAYLDGERFSLEVKALRAPPAPMNLGTWPTMLLYIEGALFDDGLNELEFNFGLAQDKLGAVVEALDFLLVVR